MLILCFFCFKQKTAYEMRISDWSSDVCSSDLTLPPTDIVPSIEFSSDLTIYAYGFETHRFVQRNARLVRQRDAGKSSVIASACCGRQQTRIWTARYATSLCAGRDIDCYVDRGPVGRACPMLGSVGVADNLPVHFGYQIGIVGQKGGDSPFNLQNVRRHLQIGRANV